LAGTLGWQAWLAPASNPHISTARTSFEIMDEPSDEPGWRPRYNLATLLKAMLILSILTAMFGGLLREYSAGNVSAIFFLAMVLAAPLAIMIGLSLVDPIRKLLTRRGGRKK
jgi:mannitol-specific phosphotransferase system IIBC component